MKQGRLGRLGRSARVWTACSFVVLAAGCVSNEEDDCNGSAGKAATDPYNGEYMFERCTALEVSASRQQFAVGDTLTIMLACDPVFSGVGRARVQFLPQRQSATYKSMVIDAPTDAVRADDFLFWAPVRFEAGKRFEMPWRIRVREKSAHSIYGWVRFDSVFVAADSALHSINSPEAEQEHGLLDERPAVNYPAYPLSEPTAAPGAP